jgi:hypothetical protein
MLAYKAIIAENTTLVLSTDSDLFKFLKGITPKRIRGNRVRDLNKIQSEGRRRSSPTARRRPLTMVTCLAHR